MPSDVVKFEARTLSRAYGHGKKVTLAVNDPYVDVAVDAILRTARTCAVGDGKIFVMPLEDCIRIRTGERGTAAI